MKSMCRNLRILQEIKFHLWMKKDTEHLKPKYVMLCAVIYDV